MSDLSFRDLVDRLNSITDYESFIQHTLSCKGNSSYFGIDQYADCPSFISSFDYPWREEYGTQRRFELQVDIWIVDNFSWLSEHIDNISSLDHRNQYIFTFLGFHWQTMSTTHSLNAAIRTKLQLNDQIDDAP